MNYWVMFTSKDVDARPKLFKMFVGSLNILVTPKAGAVIYVLGPPVGNIFLLQQACDLTLFYFKITIRNGLLFAICFKLSSKSLIKS